MKHCSKLSAVALAISLGLTGAISMFVLGMMAMYWNIGNDMLVLIASLYQGYEATLVGSAIGAGWAFVDWAIGGLVIAWIYNCIVCCCHMMCRKKKCHPCGSSECPTCGPKHHDK